MDTSSSGPPPIPGYQLAAPTEADVRFALHRVFGKERAEQRWAEACATARVLVGSVDSARLAETVQALAAQGGATAAIARSIEIRMRTYARLAANSALAAGVRE
ncbi:hypothetical protein [Longimicrobium terrae]|uniref:Uncharacterized protein n=1 Tax=Longimicrobium terrae TaxID=1639882 RepID=A0A841GMI3_9BACT|nr:hypothetical protein [Longimicrobium terrae]MBB4634598.1 hypothetical protein [Longimicrobium terrae]MBB6068512.1 hypothetical protein [Longimicrobium terrae]NNC27702.1 hypothetical protein [Longimicrobium terrae]